MDARIISIFIIILIGFTCDHSFAQTLTTKCWSNDWTKYLEKCYLVVSYKHSWSKANSYCKKYGARLVEPTGITINDEISALVTKARLHTDYWIGYNIYGINKTRSYLGYWSDGRDTSVSVGVWGQNQPDTEAGDCTYVRATETGNKWYITECDRVMPFVCEMEPCPTGTFMCSGRCITNTCDGVNDCGDWRDEFNCSKAGNKCKYSHTGESGIIEGSSSLYPSNADCLWAIETKPGKRINVQFEYFETEVNTDFLEIWDGGLTLETSSLMSRLSGQLTHDQMTFTSSYNFMLLRFVSDSNLSKRGFRLSWTTEYICTYKTVPFSTFSNTEIQEGKNKTLGSRQSASDCVLICDESPTCFGFTYFSSPSYCRFFSALPILATDEQATMYMKTCPPGTVSNGSVPLPLTSLTAIAQAKQLSTPLYPLPYVGNMELAYSITTMGNNIITLKVMDVDLCCDDTVKIYDGTTSSHTLLETLTTTSEPHLILSTSQNVYIKMTMNTHWKCRGVLMTYKQGCDNTLTETGMLKSPGYGSAIGYPGVMQCTWTLRAPTADRSITIVFEAFQLEQNKDFLTITTANGSSKAYTGTELMSPNSLTADNYMVLTLTTSAVVSFSGFSASFSPGCSSLQSASVDLDSSSYNYLDVVTMRCTEGYYFEGDHKDKSNVTLTCTSGGSWDLSPLPTCARGYCGSPPLIENGYILNSTGVQGGDTATYECNNDFTIEGAQVIKCNASHQWDRAPNCTSGVCPSVSSVTSGVIDSTLFGDGSQYGSVARLSCGDYKEIHGAATVKCVNGSWDFVNDEPTLCHLKPCPTPLIDNSYLSPEQPYAINQVITVTCKAGYGMIGNQTINCGVTTDMPKCEKIKCVLNFDNVVPKDNSNISEYAYGDKVEVKCAPRYELVEVNTTSIVLTCLSTRNWNFKPSCSKSPLDFEITRADCKPYKFIGISCGEPQPVQGAVYAVSCLGYGCEFRFICKDNYELYGASTANDDIVRCGGQYDGLWDFGDLRCIGGQCLDPGYPPSGYLKGSSFQEGSVVTFGCNQNGYGPVPPYGLICQYNEDTKTMVWNSTVPSCVDITDPVIYNCPITSTDNSIKIANMEPAIFFEPSASDNTYIKRFTTSPLNFHPGQPLNRAMTVIYRAYDFQDRLATCEVRISIPDHITCLNSKSLNYLVKRGEVLDSQDLLTYVENKDEANSFVYFSPTQIEVKEDSSMLQRIDEVSVTARDKDGVLLDSCKLQFRYRGYKCSKWGIHIPGGGAVSCQPGYQSNNCNAYCTSGSYFMEDPDATSIAVTCTEDEEEGVWNRAPPVCASTSATYVIYTAQYDNNYNISSGISTSDWTTCAEVYKQQLEAAYPTLTAALTDLCNANKTNNLFSLTVQGLTPATMSFHDGSNTLSVRTTFVISLQDQTVDNVLGLKDSCAHDIQKAFSSTNSSELTSILAIQGSTQCGSGIYVPSAGTPVTYYDCSGHRKLHTVSGRRSCLTCPLGYSLDVVTTNCVPCPDGTYGVQTPSGPECHDCPLRGGPNMTALTSQEQCSIPAIAPRGYYSDDGLKPFKPCPFNFYSLSTASQSCIACPTDRITLTTGSTSEADCKSLDELVNATSPCNPNPCFNKGECSFVRSAFFCTCKPGNTGRQCQTPFNACSSKPCKNDQRCIPDLNDTSVFNCSCSDEFEGPLCEKDVFGCSNSQCNNNGTCHNRARGGYSCMCPAAGGFMNDDGSCGNEIDQCLVNPCQEGTCIAHASYYRSCDCYPGYTGISCETNINDCDPNPCRNGGTCVDGVDSFSCRCDSNYHGDFCEFQKACNKSCDGTTTVCNTCMATNTEMCENFGDSFNCHCKTGYTGTNCETGVSACSNYPCQHGGTCRITQDDPGYTCACNEPWTGDNCEIEKTTNCPDGSKCFNNGTCYSTPSGFQCRCTSDFIGKDCNIAYDLCERVNACVGDGSQCSYTKATGFECQCGSGISGVSCQIPAPTCTPDYCYNGGVCDDSTGTLKCSCKTGFEGSRCETNKDDCTPNPCLGANQQCMDLVNSYYCHCDDGKRGENCDKDVGGDFDYVIEAPQGCRQNEAIVRFGDGLKPITQLSVVFWARYTQKAGLGTIMNIYGSVGGDTMIPTKPDFAWRFDATGFTFGTNGNKRRKKRADEKLSYEVDIADGLWHHITLTWSDDLQEMTLYVDGYFKNQLADIVPSSTRGFVVFGDYSTSTRKGDGLNSFKGRISRFYIVNKTLDDTEVGQLYNFFNTPPSSQLLFLHQENNLMLQYMVDYNSEISQNRCRSADDQTCERIYNAGDSPRVTSCDDVLVVTERASAPSWPDPTFTNTNPGTKTTNRISGSASLDWGIYGISVAEMDNSSNIAAVCSFRLYNYPAGCSSISSDAATCTPEAGDQRCSGSCSGSGQLTGSNSVYQTCSKYLMWDEAVKQETYNYPTCAATKQLTYRTTLSLKIAVENAKCDNIKESYSNYYLGQFNTFNLVWEMALCGGDQCSNILRDTFTCANNTEGDFHIKFGYLPKTMSSSKGSLSPHEVLRVAVADESTFSFEESSGGPRATPDLRSLEIHQSPACEPGYQVSGNVCVMCGSGTYFNSSTSTCERCPKGEYRDIQDGKTNLASPCTKCPTGLTTASDGSPDQLSCKANCLPGRYFNTAAGQCVDCPVGFYQSKLGQFFCTPCDSNKITYSTRRTSSVDCILQSSITTTTTPSTTETFASGPDAGAATEDSGLSTGVLVAIILGVIIVLVIIVLIVCLVCFKCQVPCLAKTTQEVSPEVKGGYYADKYGERDMRFVNYNLQNLREKKSRPLDKEPFVEPTLSEESGSLKNDISIHVPVFMEKLDGSVSRKHMYMSNNLKPSVQTPRLPVTSSPRTNEYQEIDFDNERKHKKKRRKKSRKPAEIDTALPTENGQIPKALAPMPQRIRSVPPSDVHIRPSSALERPRDQVVPSHYRDFLPPSTSTQEMNHYEPAPAIDGTSKHAPSSEPVMDEYDDYRYPVKKIEVESDEDLR